MGVRLRCLNALLRLTAKPALARTNRPESAAVDLSRASRLFRQPPHLLRLERPGPPPLHWISAGPCQPRRAVLWLHGGGYVAGSPATHQGMLGRLSRLSGVEICAPAYRLAQEAPFPAAFDDACAAWEALRRLGYRPADIVLGGDSAGGGLALALLAHLGASGERAAGLVAFSPWTDLTLSGGSVRENARRDPLLPPARAGELVAQVMAGADPADPRASPLFARFEAPPPVLIQLSESEILRDDGLRIAERLRGAGGAVEVQAWPDTPHVWQIFDGWIPEARAALRQAGEFIRNVLVQTSLEAEIR
ncbi:MAG: alpha/beta hydrolase [Paracoccaceae bacterium]